MNGVYQPEPFETEKKTFKATNKRNVIKYCIVSQWSFKMPPLSVSDCSVVPAISCLCSSALDTIANLTKRLSCTFEVLLILHERFLGPCHIARVDFSQKLETIQIKVTKKSKKINHNQLLYSDCKI